MIDASKPSNIPEPAEHYYSAGGDFLDSQLESADHIEIGRVAGIEAEWREDGKLVLVALLTGPQTLAGRVARPLYTLFRWILHDHFDHAIPMSELAKVELVLHLRGNATDYPTGHVERWLTNHILRWIPGSGYKKSDTPHEGKQIEFKPEREKHIIWMQELLGSKIVTHDGKKVGHIFDLQVSHNPEYEVVSIVYGRLAMLYRMHVLHPFAHMLHLKSGEPETIAWNQVASREHRKVTLKKP